MTKHKERINTVSKQFQIAIDVQMAVNKKTNT